ncbi:MAG: UxaA family hydrolase, partial [Acetobacteraceae bacterium]|nr:UxaA family hydrolase [Acetobacteraceae bacterium]
SLGNIAKCGRRPFEGLVAYGEAPPRPGLWAMDAAAYAPESVTGFVLAGAQVVLFTTGVGNSYASALAPTLKLTANPETCAASGGLLDFDASTAFTGAQSMGAAALGLRRRLLEIASGRATWGEILGEGDEVLSRYEVAL